MNTKPIRRFLRYTLSASLLLVLIAGAVTVHAAFPGTNGKIAFAGTIAGFVQVFVMNPDGTNPIQLTNTSAHNNKPSWSADGTRIVFVSYRDGGDPEIYRMNADGSNQTRLTNVFGGDDNPHWSPDGTQIVFNSDRGSGVVADIFTMNADGTNQINITNSPSGTDDSPAWSPDGTKIAFNSFRDGNIDVYVMDVFGTSLTRLTTDPAIDGSPDWSPDGTKITFMSLRDGSQDVYVMNADGTNQTRLTTDPSVGSLPAWSPDGAKIAFNSDRNGNNEIYVMDANGNNQINITNTSANETDPNWQPVFYSFSGFFQPVDNLPTLNVVKAGQAIPVKFSLNGDQGLNIFAAGYPRSQNILCDSTAVVDGIEETVTAGSSSLSYDPSTDTYNYVWKTDKAWANTCRQLVVKLNDGTYHRANFKFN